MKKISNLKLDYRCETINSFDAYAPLLIVVFLGVVHIVIILRIVCVVPFLLSHDLHELKIFCRHRVR